MKELEGAALQEYIRNAISVETDVATQEEAISRFAKKLRNMGVDEELEKLGVEEGDTIKILDYEFEYTK